MVIILFSGYQGMNSLKGTGGSHQSNPYFCLFTVCVAIVAALLLFIVILYTTAVLDLTPPPKSAPLSRLEKPPRRSVLAAV